MDINFHQEMFWSSEAALKELKIVKKEMLYHIKDILRMAMFIAPHSKDIDDLDDLYNLCHFFNCSY